MSKILVTNSENQVWSENENGTWSESIPEPLWVGWRLRKAKCICGKKFKQKMAYQLHYRYAHTNNKEYTRTPKGMARIMNSTTPSDTPQDALDSLRQLIQDALATVEYDYRAAHKEILEQILAKMISREEVKAALATPKGHIPDESCCYQCDLRSELLKRWGLS